MNDLSEKRVHIGPKRKRSLVSACVKPSELQKCGTKPKEELGQKAGTGTRQWLTCHFQAS